MAEVRKPRRARVKRGIYRQPTASSRSAPAGPGRLHFRTTGDDLLTARRAREELIAALEAWRVPVSPHRADRSSGGSAFRESRQADAFAHRDRGSPPIQRAPCLGEAHSC